MKNNIMESGVRVCFTPFYDNNLYISLMQEAINSGGYRLYKGKKFVGLFLCDVFHFNWDVFLLGGRLRLFRLFKKIIYVLCIKALGKKIVYTLHDKIPLHERDKLPRTLDFIGKFMLKHADRIVIHSSESVSVIKETVPGINTDKIIYVPHPNYITAYSNTKPYSRNAKDKSRILITSVGSVKKYKCLEILIRVAKELQEYGDIHFLICGKGEDSYTAELLALTEESSNITADFRFIEDGEIPSLLEMSDAMILPYDTTSELNSGSSYLAFSFGRTIIGTRTGTTNDIDDQSLIYCYDYTDDEAEHISRLKDAILRFYADFTKDPESVRRRGEKLRDMMIQKHSLEETAKALMKAYGGK